MVSPPRENTDMCTRQFSIKGTFSNSVDFFFFFYLDLQNLACLTCDPSSAQTHSGEMSHLER